MHTLSFRRASLAAAMSFAFVLPASADLLDGAGETFTAQEMTGDARLSGFDIAALPDGFVVVWTEREPEGYDRIRARRFDQDGEPRADAFLVIEEGGSTDVALGRPLVAASDDGKLLVAWARDGESPPAFCSNNLFVSRVDADDNPSPAETPYDAEYEPCQMGLAMDADGDYAVAWSNLNHDLKTRSFLADGTVLGDTATISGGNLAIDVSVAIQDNGTFAVGWNFTNGVAEFQTRTLADNTVLHDTQPLDNGDFSDADLRRSGVALAADQDGGYVGLWEHVDLDVDTSREIRAQRWRADGTAGEALLLGSIPYQGDLHAADMDADGQGNLVGVWSGERATGGVAEGTLIDDDNDVVGERAATIADFSAYNDPPEAGSPRVAMNADMVAVAWYGSDTQTLRARVFDPDSRTVNPSGPGSSGGGGPTGPLTLLAVVLLVLRQRRLI